MSVRLRQRASLLAAICLLALGASAGAESAPRQGVARIDDAADAVQSALAPYATIGAGASFSYQYDFENPDSGTAGLRLLDKDHDSFGLDLAQITIKHDATTPGAFGFLLQPAFGRYAKRFKSDWDGSGAFNDTKWENDEVEIQQVYLAYDAPVGSGLALKLGKFNTLVGSEVNEPWNNPEYSRQLVYTLCQPGSHTGGIASYVIDDRFSVTAGGITGWDVVDDNNGVPSFIGQLGVTPDPRYVFYLTTIIGPEIPKNDHDTRYLVDYVSTLKPFGDALAIITDFAYGVEHGSSIDGSGDDAVFWGISNALVYAVAPDVDLVYRVEWLEDAGGIRTGARQRVWEMTGDVRWKITEHLYARTEYRHDESDAEPFPSATNVSSPGQDTVAGELGFAF